MAFLLTNWSPQSSSMNCGKDTGGGQVDPAVGGPAVFTYQTTVDTAAQVAVANFFSNIAHQVSVGDLLWINASDAFTSLRVATVDTTVTPATITTESFGAAAPVGTANITDNAVTSAKLAIDLVQYTRVSISLADFIAGNTTPVELLAAPGAGLKYILHRANLGVDYGGTVLAAGGTVQVTYGATAGVAGAIASNTLAAATLIAATADTNFGFSPVNTTLTELLTVNAALSLSVETADFTGGTGSTYEVDVWYSTVPLV